MFFSLERKIWSMSRPPVVPVCSKTWIVSSILASEATVTKQPRVRLPANDRPHSPNWRKQSSTAEPGSWPQNP